MTNLALRAAVLAASVALLPSANAADLRLPRIFSDHMVVQRDKPVRVWGWAPAGRQVTVEFAGQSRSAAAGPDGRWLLELPPLAASGDGRELAVRCGDERATFTDVLVGDVWIGSGQSNMELELGGMKGGDVAAFQADFPRIRLLNVPGETSDTPQDDMTETRWEICTPATAAKFSAVAFYFARDVHRALDVPIGMIESARGGTYPESWQTRESLESLKSPLVDRLLTIQDKRLADWLANPKGDDPRRGGLGLSHPTGCYNLMIHPIENFTIKGVLFYQGENSAVENNVGKPGAIQWAHAYPLTYPAVIRNWRQLFRDPELPFCIIEMAPWGGVAPLTKFIDSTSPFVRDVHFSTFVNWPHTGLVVTMDCGKLNDMHPHDKEPVGGRAALWALSEVYGVGDRHWTGPLYRTMEIKGNKAVIRFHSDGLALPLGLKNPAGKVEGFIIAGADYAWKEAQAAIVGDTVEVWCDAVPEPVAVRYAWEDAQGMVNLLVNAKGLPASPFRTDRWVPPTPVGAILDQPLLLPAEGGRPWADPGPDVLAIVSEKAVTLDGGGSSSPDGRILKHAWTQTAGPKARLSGADTPRLELTGLAEGTSVFRLTVTDDRGNTAGDDVTVRIVARSQPVADAGGDRLVPYPNTSAELDGSSSSGALAPIVRHEWKRMSGPGDFAFDAAAAAKTTVSGLEPGTHVFRLTVKDGLGETASRDVTLSVMPPAAPVVYEAFAYPAAAALDGRGGVGDVGFGGDWSADEGNTVAAGGLSFSDLAVAGNAASLKTVGTAGTARSLDASALAQRGLLADGAEVWFSFLVRDISRESRFTGMMLADGKGEAANGVGVWFDQGVTPKAVMRIDNARRFSLGQWQYAIWEKKTGLVVGRITWGATATEADTLQLFLPAADLQQPAANPVLSVAGMVDQSRLNLVVIGPGPNHEDRDVRIDEIRFGTSYYDVVPTTTSAEPDVTPPNPSPLQWAVPKPPVSDSIVTLTAVTATDLHDVEYSFENVTAADGSHKSGWQESPTWTDEGLQASTAYSYRVKARDKSVNRNETGWSPAVAVTTTPPDATPPAPNPSAWAEPPTAVAPTVVRMTAAAATDPSRVQYFFANTTVADGSHDSGWVTSPTYVDTGLEPGTEYAYTVRTRDLSPKGNVSAASAAALVRTMAAGLAIHEPFDYAAGSDLAGQGGKDTGFAGPWACAKKDGLVLDGPMAFGDLPVAGKTLKWSGHTPSPSTGSRPVDVAALAALGLLADGGELWFSMLIQGKECINAPSGAVMLQDSRKPKGQRISMEFWRYTAARAVMGNPETMVYSESADAVGTAPFLAVGRITWGRDAAAADTLQLYLPGKDLALPAANPKRACSMVLDQSRLDSLRIECGGWGSSFSVGDIRFGATYRDVVPGAPGR